MKNLLLASTALVAFASAASAEVAISGSGRMGIVYDQSLPELGNFVLGPNNTLVRTADNGIRFSSRVRVAFTLTQETDAGVTFGGSVRADNASAGNNGSGGSVFMSGAFGKLSMGDVDGAAESAVGNLSGVGYTGLGDRNEAFYLQQGNSDINSNQKVSAFALPAALYEYSTGAFTGYIGLGNPAGIGFETSIFDTADTTLSDIVIDQSVGLGAKYAINDQYSVGIGFETLSISALANGLGADGLVGASIATAGPDGLDGTADDVAARLSDDTVSEVSTNIDNWIIGGSGTFGGFTLKAQYGEASGDLLDLTQYGVSGDYTFDAYTITAYWRSVELKNAANQSVQNQPFGLGVTYDLGGGAAVQAGVMDPDILGEDYRADLGVTFNF